MIPDLYHDGAIYDRRFDETVDLPFYRTHVKNDGLELCCGTGRILLELADAGVDAHGLDFAPAMLAEARRKASARDLTLHLHEGDAREFDLGRTFSTLFIAANSIAHLYTLDDLQRHFASVRSHMRADSRYIVDMFVPSLSILLRTGRHIIMTYADPLDETETTVVEEAVYDSATQIRHIVWMIEEAGQVIRTENLTMRIFFPQELQALLTLNGFQVVEALGDHEGSPLVGGSPRQIFICATK